MKKPELELNKHDGFQMMHSLSVFTVNHGDKILLLSVVLGVVSGIGISKLEVENSFIDYFSKDTEIYRGLKLIDDKLGGGRLLSISFLNLKRRLKKSYRVISQMRKMISILISVVGQRRIPLITGLRQTSWMK